MLKIDNFLSSLAEAAVIATIAAGCALALVIIIFASRFLVEWALLHTVAAAIIASLGFAALAFWHFLLRAR